MKKAESRDLIQQDTSQLPTNAELKKLIERLLVRFENWKLQAETNPNPRAVHSLKNIISIVDSLTEVTESKMEYSYKSLSRQMSILIDSVAKLNIAITDSLMDDDKIDASEEKRINTALMDMGHAAADLMSIVLQSFGVRE